MMPENTPSISGFVIRDAIETDIVRCLELDHRYQSDHVWQMRFQQLDDGYQIMFQVERLPRPVEMSYTTDEKRLHQGLDKQNCYLVAVSKEKQQLLGYLTMWSDEMNQIGWIRDIVVSQSYRRLKIASRLLNVARRWASEHDLSRIVVATRTQNYPGIQFCQKSGLIFCGFNDQYFSNHDIAVFFGQNLR